MGYSIAFIVASLVSMGMPGLSGFIAEFPIFLGVWEGGDLNLTGTIFGLNPASFYPLSPSSLFAGIVTTAAYLLRATQSVFFGNYDADKWHDMRPIWHWTRSYGVIQRYSHCDRCTAVCHSTNCGIRCAACTDACSRSAGRIYGL